MRTECICPSNARSSSSDPITGLKNRLIDWGVVEEAELKEIDKSARSEVDKAVEEAKASPEPDTAKDMWTCVGRGYLR